MRKVTCLLGTALLVGSSMITTEADAQAVRDRNVVPVAVTLNQVLRMNIYNGGNIEFVFNTIGDYKNGLSSESATSSAANPAATTGDAAITDGTDTSADDNFYRTDFTISSSTRWGLNYGSEETTFIGTDDVTNTLALNNVGYELDEIGAHAFEAAGATLGTGAGLELYSAETDDANGIDALDAYPVILMTDNNTTDANAGDATDNEFTIKWRCGTTETANVAGTGDNMNTVALINQDPSPTPDRYVVNVVFELYSDN